MEHLHKPEILSCDAVAQIFESSFDVAHLPHEKQKAIHRHIENCGDCQNLYVFMLQLRDASETLEATDFLDEISSVRKEWQHLRLSHNTRPPRLLIGVAVIAAAALLLFGLWHLWLRAPKSPQPSVLPVSCTPAALLSPVDGVQVTHCQEGDAPQMATRDGALRVILPMGSVALSVDPSRATPRTVAVVTPKGEVQVKGTLFAVHVDQQDERVEVFRGIVEVHSHMTQTQGIRVTAGTGAHIDSGQKYELKQPIREQLIAALKDLPQERDVSRTPADEKDISIEAPGIHSADQVKPTAPDETPAPLTSGETKPVRSIPVRPESMESLLESARFCLIENDWACAQKRYCEALKNHPRHPASSAVRISLAKLELRRLNAPKKALEHYSAYLQQTPSGPLAEEALLGIANAHRQMNNTKEEIGALRRLLSQFPTSAMSAKAQNRLTQLEANPAR